MPKLPFRFRPVLHSITVKGFKSIEAIEDLELSALNVVIGANGSGKSNFLGVFSLLRAIRDGGLVDYVGRAGGADRLMHFGAKTTGKIALELAFAEDKNRYEIELVPTAQDALRPSNEHVGFWDKPRFKGGMLDFLTPLGMEAGISAAESQGIAKYVREYLSSWRLYHFHDTGTLSPMKRTADVDDVRYLHHDGRNLPAFLRYLRDRHGATYDLIRRTVQQAAPFFDDFVLEPQKVNEAKIKLEWRHRRSDAYFDASSLSDGTLRFVALATLLLQPRSERPSVILIDEPELGLHPYATTLLASMLKQVATETQVIVSTQSALLLDHFQPEDVLVADLVEGATQLRRLDPADYESWLNEYSLGQLWEKNELGGRPGGGPP